MEGIMAVKPKVYVSRTRNTVTVKERDVTILKNALKRVFAEYRELKAQQRRVEDALGDLCAITTRWSIPRKECTGL
jgi:hypothetical protein